MTVLIIGGGPAGLMAAEQCARAGLPVTVADAKPSLGRKFLMAGKSGLNLTKNEPFDTFLSAYGDDAIPLRAALSEFGPDEVMAWAEGLDQRLFSGSTGRVFPAAMKASPLLRSWQTRLMELGVEFKTRWRWLGWEGEAALFGTPEGQQRVHSAATILALGGASWARLGSDGLWVQILAEKGIALAPFAPANVGVRIDWSTHMCKFLGHPVKAVAFHAGADISRGEAVLSANGLEGGGIYMLSKPLRNGADLSIDLAPDLSQGVVAGRLAAPRGKSSLSNHLRKRIGLGPVRQALLNEFARPLPKDSKDLARLIKAVPVPHKGPTSLDAAISTAGGVPFTELDTTLQLKKCPGIWVAGEMLDWEAPTGGYLLTACLATGRWAGRAIADQLA